MPAGAPAAGLSLSNWIGLASLIATIVGIPLTLIGAHFHSAIRKDDARATIIQRLTSTRRRDLYYDYLRIGLSWLDEKIGPPPLARLSSRKGRWIWGMKSLGVCFALSLAYSVLAYLAGLVAGGPAALGQVTLIESRPWGALAWAPEWLPRALLAVIVVIVGAYLLWRIPIAVNWAEQSAEQLAERLGRHLRPRLKSVLNTVMAMMAGTVVGSGYLILGFLISNRLGGTLSLAIVITIGTVVFAYTGFRDPSTVRVPVVVGLAGSVTGVGMLLGLASGALSRELALTQLLFFFVLPCLNGVLDWI